MKALIIDDNPFRIECLKDIFGKTDDVFETTYCESLSEGTDSITSAAPSLLILDVNLPWKRGSTDIRREFSLLILSKLKDEIRSGACSVIIVSSCKDSFDFFCAQEEWNDLLIFMCDDDWNSPWFHSLDRAIRSKAQLANTATEESEVLIVCAMEKEVSPFLENGWEWVTTFEASISHYLHRTEITLSSKERIRIVAVSCRSQGAVVSAAVTSALLQLLKPRVVLMPGICAGIEGKVKLGDIVLTTKSWDYSSGKISEDQDGNTVFEPAPDEIPIRPEILEHLRMIKDDSWRKKIEDHPDSYVFAKDVEVVPGPTATGAVVVANTEVPDMLKERDRRVVALEMEIHGVFYATTNAFGSGAKFIACKVVVDFASPEKNDDIQEWGAKTSASYTTWLLEQEFDWLLG